MFNQQPMINSELLSLTYGVFVSKLIREADDHSAEQVNKQLEEVGFNMGCRMIDDFFARQKAANQVACRDFRQTMDVLAKQAFKMFLGVYADVTNWDSQGQQCSLILKDNPLNDFVVLPPQLRNELWYSNVLTGIIRGALEMINLKVRATFVRDTLRGDTDIEITVELLEVMTDRYDDDDD